MVNKIEIGKFYVVQTTTLWLFVGECTEVSDSHVSMKRVSWIQEMGRLGAYFRNRDSHPQFSEYMGDNRELVLSAKELTWFVAIDHIPGRDCPNK
jgi:hypothetical protein